ncbi:hypothetical protein D3C84_1239470 [compost metagenome]
MKVGDSPSIDCLYAIVFADIGIRKVTQDYLCVLLKQRRVECLIEQGQGVSWRDNRDKIDPSASITLEFCGEGLMFN